VEVICNSNNLHLDLKPIKSDKYKSFLDVSTSAPKGNYNPQVPLMSKHLLNLRIGLDLNIPPCFPTNPLGHIDFSDDSFFV
jgi:hypothetical protein